MRTLPHIPGMRITLSIGMIKYSRAAADGYC
jgi:hypothetical protein